jgi:hypothetical protein
MTGVALIIDPKTNIPSLDLNLTVPPPEDIEVPVLAVDHLRTHHAFGIQLVERPPFTYLVIRTGHVEAGELADELGPVEEILVYRLARHTARDRVYFGHRIA